MYKGRYWIPIAIGTGWLFLDIENNSAKCAKGRYWILYMNRFSMDYGIHAPVQARDDYVTENTY